MSRQRERAGGGNTMWELSKFLWREGEDSTSFGRWEDTLNIMLCLLQAQRNLSKRQRERGRTGFEAIVVAKKRVYVARFLQFQFSVTY